MSTQNYYMKEEFSLKMSGLMLAQYTIQFQLFFSYNSTHVMQLARHWMFNTFIEENTPLNNVHPV